MPVILKSSNAAAQCLSLDVQGNVQDARISQISSKCCASQLICPGPGRSRHCGGGRSQVPPFLAPVPLLWPPEEDEDNFPEALEANNGHKSHNHCPLWRGRTSWGSVPALGNTQPSPEFGHPSLLLIAP